MPNRFAHPAKKTNYSKQPDTTGSPMRIVNTISHSQKTDMPHSPIRIVDETSHAQRLDNYLFKHYRHLPKSYIYRLLRTGQVRINKKRAKASYKLQVNDAVRLPPVLLQQTKHTPTPHVTQTTKDKCRQWILHQDEHLIVIDKPPGLSVHADAKGTPGLIELLTSVLNKHLYLVHRVDKQTSGLVLISQDRTMLLALQDQFRQRTINKKYQALVAGCATWRTKTITLPLAKHSTALRTVVDANGKEAKSHFTCIKAQPRISHILATPHTGRMHQLRVHLQQIGLPIIGDPLYMQEKERHTWHTLGFKRLCLHAYQLSYRHPYTQATVSFQSRHNLFAQYEALSPTYE